eukprot:2614178-Pyramimonas_sp.AAC.1
MTWAHCTRKNLSQPALERERLRIILDEPQAMLWSSSGSEQTGRQQGPPHVMGALLHAALHSVLSIEALPS